VTTAPRFSAGAGRDTRTDLTRLADDGNVKRLAASSSSVQAENTYAGVEGSRL
jgi:hypothetical protein